MFSRSFRLMSLMGFDVKIDPSWFLIAALITWSLATGYFPFVVPGGTLFAYVVMALAAMLLFFGSLILHELAHSVVARRFGMKIKGITLFLFGGVAELGAEPETAKAELWVALAGPAMSIALAALFWVVEIIAVRLELPDPAAAIFGYLALINLVLALFNLLPAFPLDGGRVLRALLWKRHGNLLKATRVASMSGTILAWLLIALGLFSVVGGSAVGGIWQVLIGLFLLGAAKNAYRQQLMATVVTHQTVGDLMSRSVVTTAPERTLMSLVHDTVLRHRFSFIPVVEEGRLLGYIDLDTAMLTDQESWPRTRVDDVLIASDDSNTASPDMTAEELIDRMADSNRRKYLVADGKRLVGVISMSDLINYLALTRQVSELSRAGGSKPSTARGQNV
ncbi:site-2 protease family protein [Roseovarius sp. Pro17]|uniref:site-2 protease family protein n=1 Tax=Roseovarius sp. Pro17 TaxID=3108175 RepID=UPI002D789A49|nr:site-2 protease family protein [Roseovarius sp. Pro17]